jgi:hypothetical protein
MEAWATVVIVLVSNAIIGAVSVMTVRKQLKHSREQFKMGLEVQKEADKHERQREVRSEPLLKLRGELARMAAKGEKVVDVAKSTVYKVLEDVKLENWREAGEVPNELGEAMKEWNTYVAGGEFQQVLFMQYDMKIVERVNEIKDEYNLARHGLNVAPWFGWLDEERKKQNVEAIEQRIHRDVDVIIGNRERIAEVQSDINKLLEEL